MQKKGRLRKYCVKVDSLFWWQDKLNQARIFIAGAGGLALLYHILGGSWGWVIRVVDHNSVALSNLNRQVLHWEGDTGRRKVDSATEKLKRLKDGYKNKHSPHFASVY